MNYNESAEDYLEAILMLREQLGKVRSIDIVYKLGYSKPSISIAMKKLREKGLVHMDENGYITLTEEGLKIARHTYNRHKVLTLFFESIGVNPSTAEHDACKIEHDISDETFKRLKEHMQSHNLNGRHIHETVDFNKDE
ncbi:MAG: metal-dependent transcriptional regulator [Lachnospiraceae bacterium]|nr:metal-dependent transcriptional regulator [Lachnospiraceae bacterium]